MKMIATVHTYSVHIAEVNIYCDLLVSNLATAKIHAITIALMYVDALSHVLSTTYHSATHLGNWDSYFAFFVYYLAVDNDPPVVDCNGRSFTRFVPAGTQSLEVLDLPTCSATDNSGTVLPLPQNPPPGTSFPVGTTVVRNAFEDPSGNQAVGEFTVTIIEGQQYVYS